MQNHHLNKNDENIESIDVNLFIDHSGYLVQNGPLELTHNAKLSVAINCNVKLSLEKNCIPCIPLITVNSIN